MVYPEVEIDSHTRGADLKSVAEVMKDLNITKMTLYKWILQKKIKVRHVQIGARTFLGFSENEVNRVKGLMVKKREKGKSLIQG